MSLLRRRMMMTAMGNNKKLYIYSGYIGSKSTADSDPEFNSSYPDASCTSAIFLYSGDTVAFEAVAKNHATRRYNSDGQYIGTGYVWKFKAGSDYYLRFLTNNGVESFEKLTVTHADGSVDEYEIIDRR